jgi:hypothetical protein
MLCTRMVPVRWTLKSREVSPGGAATKTVSATVTS